MIKLNIFIVRKLIMDLSEVYLRQLNEKLSKQIQYQEMQINLQKEQIELLKGIDKTNKDMEAYIKGLNQQSTNS
tara:strand:- start:247 stop:468 length:222 start_codon:yes stop_codon:yes gene_type:complete